VHFTVPTRMTLPGATLSVQIDALDAHANRLATVEQRIRVEAAPAVAVNDAPVREAPAHAAQSPEHQRGDEPTRSGGFWSTAWPYVIGGVALAAGGTAAFFLTRPPDGVSIDAARVQVR
jgi:hypothetical protein